VIRFLLRPAHICLLGVLLLCEIAAASDGVVEINQTCAMQTGCLAGDTPGFPIVLGGGASTPRSFRLTGDLQVAAPDTTAIYLYLEGATLDLNGFAIRSAACSGSPTVCSGSGFGTGIFAQAPYVTLRNGSVSGFDGDGIRVEYEGARVRNIRAVGNGRSGIYLRSLCPYVALCPGSVTGFGGIIEDSHAEGNLGEGINLDGDAVLVLRSTIRGNGSYGIGGLRGLLAAGNTLHANVYGLNAGAGALVIGNVIEGNGIFAGAGSAVVRNYAMPSASSQTGIGVVAGSRVESNIVNGAGTGLSVSAGSGYRDNVLNTSGSNVSGAGVNLGGNGCLGAPCP